MNKTTSLIGLAVFLLLGCEPTSQNTSESTLAIQDENGKFNFVIGDRLLLSYQYEMVYPPQGVDSIYGRSAFIHPLNAPHGQVLTRIQPDDHYHHYGVWNPWTHVLYDGDTLDFWNLKKGEGTVRFAEVLNKSADEQSAGIIVKEEHVVLNEGKNEVALNETKVIKISEIRDDSYVLDLTINYSCATDKPFKILEYRYEGLGWRATEEWHKGNSEAFSSEVDTRDEIDGTTARWCVVQGTLKPEYGGAVMMSHPDNFNHPEPMRVWPSDNNPRTDLFASFTTTKNTDWLLEPGKKYNLKYRFLIFNGKMTKEKAEEAWQAFAEN